MKKLIDLRAELKVPKSQYNSFGKYNYRSQEDILEAVKPLLKKYGLHLNITDEVVEVGGRVYVKAFVSIKDGDEIVTSTGYAREPENKKGMDESQITGTASSYARKYALNALFLIDDTRDADTDEYKHQANKASSEQVTLRREIEDMLISGENIIKEDVAEWTRKHLNDPADKLKKIKEKLSAHIHEVQDGAA